MRYLHILFVLLGSSTISYSQKDSLVYNRPNSYTEFFLDSMNIPYITLDRRCNPDFYNADYIAIFRKYFNRQLIYCPNQHTPTLELQDESDIFGELTPLFEPDGIISEFHIDTGSDHNPWYKLVEYYDIVVQDDIRIYYFNMNLYKLTPNQDWELVTGESY
jgi:hypothetical protein